MSLLIDRKGTQEAMEQKINAESESYQSMKRSRSFKGLLIGLGCFGILIIVFVVTVLVVFSRIQMNAGRIEITKAAITTGIDEQGNPLPSTDHFPADQPRIYCYVSVSSPKPISLGARWFYGDTLIYKDMELVNGWRAFYIEPSPGEIFKEGEYRVEIYLVDEAIRTITFTVGK